MSATWTILAFVFAAVWVYALFREDWRRPEPVWMVLLAAGAGALSFLAADRVEAWLLPDLSVLDGPLAGRVRVAMLIAGPVEETAKLLAILVLVWPRTEFDETVDGIVYGAAAGAGFALLENILATREDPAAILARGPIGTAAHVLFATLWGGALGVAGHATSRLRWLLIVLAGLAAAALAHGAFDVVSFTAGREITMQQGRYLQIAILVACFLFLRPRLRAALRTFPFRYQSCRK